MQLGQGKISIILVIILFIALFPLNYIPEVDSDLTNPSLLTNHSPIHINGNSQFTTANGVSSGTGTNSNPYIIQNWSIAATNSTGIHIENTNSYFVIRNCHVFDGKRFGANEGIHIEDVTNGIIKNNRLTNNDDGILLYNADDNIVSENNCTGNNNGIRFFSSELNIVNNNTCKSNTRGIYIQYTSYNNTIANNTVVSNSQFNSKDYNIYNSIGNVWNITKTLGRNIINGPYLGGNFWLNYTGADLDGDGLGDTYTPFNDGDYHPLTYLKDLIPPILIDKTKGLPTTGDPFGFNATAIDLGSVNSVTVKYWFDDGSPENATMVRVNGDAFNGDYFKNITVPSRAFYLHYQISASDLIGFWNNTIKKVLKVIDNDPPVITENTSAIPTTGDNFTINISVIDNIKVSEVYLEYWFDNNPPINNTLTKQNQFYNTTITVPDNATILKYIISAIDNSSNWAIPVIKNPIVIDNDKPVIVDLGGTPTTGDDYLFEFDIIDNIEVSISNLKFWEDDKSYTIVTLPQDFSHHTEISPDAYTLHYYVLASDSSNNVAELQVIREVIDNDPPIINDQTIGDPETGNDFQVKWTVTENRKLHAVSIEYWFDDGEQILEYVNVKDGFFFLDLDVPIDALEMHYIITAEDAANNSAQINRSLKVIDIIPPDIFDITENKPTTGDPLIIEAYAIDNIMVESFNLEIWFDDYKPVNISFNDTYDVLVPSNARLMHLIFTAIDTSGNMRELKEDIDVIDNDPPIIYDIVPKPTTGDKFKFNIEVFDNIEVAFSHLEYWFDDGDHVKIQLDKTGGIHSTITPINAKILYYLVYAEDISQNPAIVDREIDVIDNDPPVIEDFSIKKGNTLRFIAKVNDNIGVSEVRVNFWFEDGIINTLTIYLKEGMYEGELTIPDGNNKISYLFYSEDTSGNWNNSKQNDFETLETKPGEPSKNQDKYSFWVTLIIIIIILILIFVIVSVYYTIIKKKRKIGEEPISAIDAEAITVKPGALAAPTISIGNLPAPAVVTPLPVSPVTQQSTSTLLQPSNQEVATPVLSSPVPSAQAVPAPKIAQPQQLPQLPPAPASPTSETEINTQPQALEQNETTEVSTITQPTPQPTIQPPLTSPEPTAIKQSVPGHLPDEDTQTQ
jgi:parallel beta-helix repeat protein